MRKTGVNPRSIGYYRVEYLQTPGGISMRIAFFAWEYPPVLVGGLGTYAENMARKFVELGHDVTLFALNEGNLPTREVVRGVEVHRPIISDASTVLSLISPDLASWQPGIKFFSDFFMYNVLSASKFINLLAKAREPYDIVCFHDWLNTVAGLMVKDQLGIPSVFHAHSTEWGRTGDGSETIKSLERTAAKKADAVITASRAMKQDLSRHGWPGEKIHVIWNGVDPERYHPGKCSREDVTATRDRYAIREEDKMILFVGRLTWYKGIRNLVLAMPQVLGQVPEAQLVILGRGKQQHDIVELARRLGIEEKIHYRFEFVPEQERILHYAASDLCVFPSTYEPFAVVSLEAMSMEKPVVVGANGVVGFTEQVVPSGPEQNGVHVDGNNPADIAWGITEALSNERRAREWGRKGRKRVLRYFTWEKAAEQTISCYEKILSG